MIVANFGLAAGFRSRLNELDDFNPQLSRAWVLQLYSRLASLVRRDWRRLLWAATATPPAAYRRAAGPQLLLGANSVPFVISQACVPLIIFVELNFKHVVHQAIFEFIVSDPTTRLNVRAFVDFVVDALAQNTLAERDQG